MNKQRIENCILGIGITSMSISGFAALVTVSVLRFNQPYDTYFYRQDAEKLANSIAKSMRYDVSLVEIKKLNTHYLLKPYDTLRYDLTGDFSLNNFTQDNGYYVRSKPFNSKSDYIVPKEKCLNSSKQALADQFNTKYNNAIYSQTHHAGNPHAVHNCEKALIVMGILFATGAFVTIIGCCPMSSNADNDNNTDENNADLNNEQIEGCPPGNDK